MYGITIEDIKNAPVLRPKEKPETRKIPSIEESLEGICCQLNAIHKQLSDISEHLKKDK